MKFKTLMLLVALVAIAAVFSSCDMMKSMENTCTISGYVYVNDAPLPNPEVMAYDVETGKAIQIHNDEDQLIGKEDGYYAIRRLRPGKYMLKVRTRQQKLLTKPGEEEIVDLKLGRIEERDIYINTN